jgi:cytochrome bd-type quinol oxidase subunit 1
MSLLFIHMIIFTLGVALGYLVAQIEGFYDMKDEDDDQDI